MRAAHLCLPVALVVAALAGCAPPPPASPLRCVSNAECAYDARCVDGRCEPRSDTKRPGDDDDGGPRPGDSGPLDAGLVDGGVSDGGASDGGASDGGGRDGGGGDGGAPPDGGGRADGGSHGGVDAGSGDGGRPDAGCRECRCEAGTYYEASGSVCTLRAIVESYDSCVPNEDSCPACASSPVDIDARRCMTVQPGTCEGNVAPVFEPLPDDTPCGFGCACREGVPTETSCGVDSGDEDGDGLFNCADPDCAAVDCSRLGVNAAHCGADLQCHESVCTCIGGDDDDDGDGQPDCTDPDCEGLFSASCPLNCGR